MIWTQKHSYLSKRNPDELKRYIEKVCKVHQGVDLAGKFVSEDEFRLTPRGYLRGSRTIKSGTSSLDGRIYRDHRNRTVVDFSLYSNPVYALLFFACPIGAIALYFTESGEDYFLLSLIIGALGALVFLAMGQISRDLIRDRFIATFELKKNEEHVD